MSDSELNSYIDSMKKIGYDNEKALSIGVDSASIKMSLSKATSYYPCWHLICQVLQDFAILKN